MILRLKLRPKQLCVLNLQELLLVNSIMAHKEFQSPCFLQTKRPTLHKSAWHYFVDETQTS